MISDTLKHTMNTTTPVYDAYIKSKMPLYTKDML
jgi:hypothetical protein